MNQLPECDYCDTIEIITEIDGKKISNLKLIGDSKVCPECEKKGIHTANERQKQASMNMDKLDAPIDINDVLRQSRDIDASIQVRTDLFNAATIPIIELKKSIDSDETITNKPFALANELMNRLNHFKELVFELNEKVMNAQNNQRAIQTYLNQMSNQLRQEEREKLKIQDINYKPGPIKTVTPKAIKLAKPRLDKKELRKYAAELGVAEFTLQMLVVSKGITVEKAAELLKKSIESAKSKVESNDGQTSSINSQE